MKNQIFRGLFMSLFALTLTACVGAVNVPAGTITETKTEKTESETQTPEKLVIKEPEPQNIITTEPKPISANSCIANPFGNACSVEFNFIREVACHNELFSDRCAPTITRVCTANSLDKLCQEQKTVCLNELDSERCAPTIARVCNTDSLDTLCIGNETYFLAQETACADAPNSERCIPTITRVCLFDPLYFMCEGNEKYFTAQEKKCEGVGFRDYYGCSSTITRVCDADSLSRLCEGRSEYFSAQKTACAGKSDSYKTARFEGQGRTSYFYPCRLVSRKICGDDIFNPYCYETDVYLPARIRACKSEQKSERCAPIIAGLAERCGRGSRDDDCIGFTVYYSAQERACNSQRYYPYSTYGVFTLRSNFRGYSTDCASTIVRVCDADPLASLCEILPAYYPAQEAACQSEKESDRCAPTIARVCPLGSYPYSDKVLFNPLCEYVHYYWRLYTCRDEPNSDRCAPTIARACTEDPLDSLCDGNETYFSAQETACASELNFHRCTSTIARVCAVDVLNTLCVDDETYFSAQETACASELNSLRCDRATRRICKTTPFDAVCQSKNLTLHDLPAKSSNYFIAIDGNSVSSSCEYKGNYTGYVCSGLYPTNIDIEPLKNNNTGIATYAGSISMHYILTSNAGGPKHVTEDIDLMVDFDNKTLNYSGSFLPRPRRVGGGELHYSVSRDFNIDGNFTDRGQITGTASWLGIVGDLIGLIGQEEAIGVFSSGSSRGHYGALAGGFTATREQDEE